MRRHPSPTAPFEVWCNHCRTSFATGTKRCIHCGERLAKRRFDPRLEISPEMHEAVLVEEEAPTKKGPFSPLTIVWILVLGGGYLFQMCYQD